MQFNNAINYIRSQSDQNADKVKLTVLTNIEKLSYSVHEHRQDPLKKNNDGNHRYFELLKLRISYYSTPGEIIITRIRHTKQEPKQY